MEVRVSDIVLLSVSWESSVSVLKSVVLGDLSDFVFPMLHHLLFFVFSDNPEPEGLIKMENKKNPNHSFNN